MDYYDFLSRDDARKEFLTWREKLNKAQELYDNSFNKIFSEAVKKAGEGDSVMQDVVAYYYKSGVERCLDEDYNKYMKWEVLSAAQGNEFAIEKMQFFLGYAYDQIIADPLLPKIKYYNGLDEYNYIYIIGQRICEELVNKLQLSASELASQRDINAPYRPEYFRDWRKSVDEVIPIVIEKMSAKKNN